MDVPALVALALSGFQTFTGAWAAFNRTKLETLCGRILDSQQDVSKIMNDPTTQGYFFAIVHHYLHEANDEKLEQWKNAMIHLMFDYYDFPRKDNLLSILSALTAFDLTVLTKFYGISEGKHDDYLLELYDMFSSKGVSGDWVIHAVRRLASQGLIAEMSVQPSRYSISSMGLRDQSVPLRYTENNLGLDFLKFIADYTNQYPDTCI
jgi:hypothetical protein